jgi:hypothetical protein
MPRIVRSARGEAVDFDVILIKNQLAQAPQNIEVKRRQDFIDNKETTERKRQQPDQWLPMPEVAKTPALAITLPNAASVEVAQAESSSTDFDAQGTAPVTKVEPPAPPTITRSK